MTAACAGVATATFDPWFSSDPAEQEWAKARCAECPIGPECLAGARARGEQHGIWFGEWFGPESLGMATVDELVAELLPTHGSRSSYTAGCHCSECTHANTVWMAAWRRDRAWSVPVEHAPMPEQLDLFATAVVTEPDWISL